MDNVQLIALIAGLGLAAYMIWRPSIGSFLAAGIVNLAALGLYLF